MTVLLEIERFTVRYDRLIAVNDVSLQAHAGEVTAVIGPNGAGKTSLVNAVMGLVPFDGRLAFPTWPQAARSTEARVCARISLVPETRDLFGPMTVFDNLRLGAFAARGEPSFDMTDRLDGIFRLFPRLAERRDQRADTLSGGERQMLALGRALMLRPRFLMLDEPSLGLAPLIVAEMFRVIARLRDEGVSILLIEQNARAALRLSDRAYVLENGAVRLHGMASDIAADPRVIEAYLGGSMAPASDLCHRQSGRAG
jgi:branched-chain amino acid transport system ATP-binding protein